MWNGINRRKFPRVHYKCIIQIKTMDSSKSLSTNTENIGEGGICVILEEDLGLFQGVNLEIDLESGMPQNIKCSGTVVWVIKKRDPKAKGKIFYDTGVEFVDISEEDRERIIKIVSDNMDKVV